MADYNEIKGQKVQYLSSDPTLTSATEGQVWYNTTTGTLKGLTQFRAWSAGGNLNTARYSLAGAGTQTAALGFGGYTTTRLATTEEYSGFAWSAGGNLGTATYNFSGAGTQTAGLQVGGNIGPPAIQSTDTEEYDGSAWTAGGSLTNGRNSHSAAGTQTAGLAFGGEGPGGSITSTTEEYDGSAWTAGGALSTATQFLSGGGVQTAALKTAGRNPPSVYKTDSEEYDGTSWTTGGNLNNARISAASNIGGAQNNALIAGGFIGSGPPAPRTTQSEEYDGSAWSIGESMATAKSNQGQAGSRSAAVGFAGYSTTTSNTTEEYNSSIDTFTAAAWSSGGNLPSAKKSMGSSKGGDINSSLFFGGSNVPMGAGIPQLSSTEEYNGTSWTGGGNVGNPVSGSTGAGTQTAMIGATGYSFAPSTPPWGTPGASYIANAFEYDGSSWSNVTALPTTGVGLNSFGTQTASVFGGGAQGGSPGPEASNRSTTYHEYDGTSWTSGGSSNTVHGRTQAAAGILTAGIVFGGTNPTGARGDTLESYNGTTWTEESSGLIAAVGMGAFGTQTSTVFAGGDSAPIPSSPGTVGYNVGTYNWNGTALTSSASTASNHMYTAGDGTSGATTGFIGGGSSAYASNTTSTEEYTEATTPVTTASTLSSS
jgi:hypothetical protein